MSLVLKEIVQLLFFSYLITDTQWVIVSATGVSVIVENTLPFMASILDSGHHYCTGVILNSRSVLVTAMCQEDMFPKAVLAGVNECDAFPNASLPKVGFRFPNPTFDFHTLEGDIAVLHVQTAIIGDRVKYAKLINRNLKVGEKVYIRGWDMNFQVDTEQPVFKVSTTVIDPLSCIQHYGAQFNPKYMLCLDYYEMSEQTYMGCEMDPSAPVYIEVEKEHYVAALSVFMPGCLYRYWPGVYINIFPYKQWILRKMYTKG